MILLYINLMSQYKVKILMCTHARHVLHENRECSLHRVSQAAIVLDDPLVAQVLQKLDFTLQRTHLLNESRKHHI